VLVPYDEYRDEWCLTDIANSSSACPDGVVNVFDLLTLLDNWDTGGPGADISADGNGSGLVDVFDLIALLQGWNCHIGIDPDSPTAEEEAIAVGLTCGIGVGKSPITGRRLRSGAGLNSRAACQTGGV
jgi:hypothetical protein